MVKSNDGSLIIDTLYLTSSPPAAPAVDASEAGEGNLEIHVLSAEDGASVPTQVRPMQVPGLPGRPGQQWERTASEAVFEVDFTPRSRCDHVVRVTFNDEDVPGNTMRSITPN